MTKNSRPYHHGNLRQALIDMAVQVADESGHEELSLREVARRLGVSSGAPFRHFPNRASLMAAIAEEATLRLRLGVERDLRKAPPDPVSRLKALGHSFILWALDKPAQFRIVSARRLFDFESSASLNVHFAQVRAQTLDLIEQAQKVGALPLQTPAADLALAFRATAYGLARMLIDGQLPQWQVKPEAGKAQVLNAMDLVVDTMVGATRATPVPAKPVSGSKPRP